MLRTVMTSATQQLGLDARMGLARRWNSLSYRKHNQFRRAYFDDGRCEWLDASYPVRMADGWAWDAKGRIPEITSVLHDARRILAERRSVSGNKPFMVNHLTKGDLQQYHSFLRFALSPALLSTVARELGLIPVLSSVKLLVSEPEQYTSFRSSQQFHLDHADRPLVKVWLFLNDVTEQCGPLCFLPAGASREAKARLGYGRIGSNYRITDEAMYAVVEKSALQVGAAKAGSILYIDTSNCFHYGSRNASERRSLLMYQYVSACRTDFRQVSFADFVSPTATLLERLVLDPDFVG